MTFPFGKTKALEKRITELETTIQNNARYTAMDMEDWSEFYSNLKLAGYYVSSETAMRIAAVFACVRLLASCLASSPVYVYKRKAGAIKGIDRELRLDHALSPILRLQPYENLGAKAFWKRMMQDKVLSGNAYAIIRRNPGGMPYALEWTSPSMINVYWAYEIGLDKKLGVNQYRLFYQVYHTTGIPEMIDQDDMLHIPNIGWNGKMGLSTVSAAAQNMGLAMAKEEHAGAFFRQGTATNIGIEFPIGMKQEAQENFEKYIMKRQSGSQNHWKPLITTDGGKIVQLNMSAKDAQLLESMQASFSDICSFFGVPTVMVRETDKQSSWGTGIEQIVMGFTKFTMNDHFTDFEQEMERKLFRDGKYFAEFDETELTRGDMKTIFDSMRIARGNSQEPGILTINEIRARIGERPVDDARSNELYYPTTNTGGANAEPAQQTV